MTTFITLTDKCTPASIAAIKTPQCREILQYLFTTHGVDNPINQSDLLLEFNAHQHTGKVLSKGSSGPISRIYEFYRKRGLQDPGFITVTKSPSKASEHKEVIANLQAKIDYLFAKLEEILEHEDIDEIKLELTEL
jgi:hypothetical protein